MGNENPRRTEEDYDIRIARDGTWWHEGAPIRRLGLVKLFASVLKRDETGAYWLVTPAERGRIAVEDAPFMAVEMQVVGSGETQLLKFRTNLDRWVTAGAEHRLTMRADAAGEAKPYVALENGLEAACTRAVYYQLAELAVERPSAPGLGVWSGGVFFPLEG